MKEKGNLGRGFIEIMSDDGKNVQRVAIDDVIYNKKLGKMFSYVPEMMVAFMVHLVAIFFFTVFLTNLANENKIDK